MRERAISLYWGGLLVYYSGGARRAPRWRRIRRRSGGFGCGTKREIIARERGVCSSCVDDNGLHGVTARIQSREWQAEAERSGPGFLVVLRGRYHWRVGEALPIAEEDEARAQR